jgi:hypothetical protein
MAGWRHPVSVFQLNQGHIDAARSLRYDRLTNSLLKEEKP